jgi:subtilisin family serine protease/subtilisin-like proprotein convertase family protein
MQLEALEERRLLASLIDLSSSPLSDAANAAPHSNSSLIVQFRNGTSSVSSLAAYMATGNLEPEWSLTPGMHKVDLASSADWAAALLAFQHDPNVRFVEPDYRVSLQQTPNDPDFGNLWGLNNTGQTGGTADADIDAPEAWDVTTGSHDTIVAVIDTGVDYTHPDLAANMWTNPGEIPGNGIDDDGNGYVDDIHGYDFVNHDGDPMDDHFHGTHVAGTIGAVGNDGQGIAGVNWHVQIMALKFLDASGGGYSSDAIAALNYAVANGAVVSNNSWGGGSYSAAFQTAIQNARAKGHIFVAAAGNDGSNNDTSPFYPASYNVDNVISVAATDHTDSLAYFSNYGASTVDLAAPGVNIYSTFPTKQTQAMKDEGFGPNYGTISGTSMATPHVTGVVALVRSAHPDWTYDQVIEQIMGTVDPIAGLKTISGGRVNAAGALGNPPPDTTGPRVISSDPPGFATGSVDHVRLQFSEALDTSTISTDDVVSLVGPSGPISVLSVTPVAGTSQLFDVTFAPQSAEGSYTLVVGPNISDKAGNLMDQDRDGVLGEDPDDRYTTSFTIVGSFVFPSQDVPAPLPPFNLLISNLDVSNDVTIADLNLTLNLSFPDVSSLMIYVTSPSGTSAYLSYGSGGPGPGFIDTTFDDEADTAISDGQPPFTGHFRPDDPLGEGTGLSAFDGENAAGTWQISIFNFSFSDSGTLNAWSLAVSPLGGAPPEQNSNSPPVAGDDNLQTNVDVPLTVSTDVLLANDTDADGDPLSIIAVNNAFGGSVQLNGDGTLTFTPEPGFVGPAGFQYVLTDGTDTAIGNVSLDVEPLFQWHNRSLAEDVNKDGVVTAIDALMIINVINTNGPTSLEFLSVGGAPPAAYLDVSADNYLAPNDALDVINFINANPIPATKAMTTQSDSAATDAALMRLLSGAKPVDHALRL